LDLRARSKEAVKFRPNYSLEKLQQSQRFCSPMLSKRRSDRVISSIKFAPAVAPGAISAAQRRLLQY
jgi:hypothetical protein